MRLYMKTKLCQNLDRSSPSGAGRVISKHVTFSNAAIDSFKQILLGAILHVLFRATNSLFKISGNRNNLRTF